MAKEKKVKLSKRLIKKIKGYAKKFIKYVGYKWILPLAYHCYCHKPQDDRLVVFVDHRRLEMPDNFQNLFDMCTAEGYRCTVLTGAPFADQIPKWERRKAKLLFHFQFMELLAKSKVVFLDDWFPLVDIVKPRQGTQIVQLWHGCGIFKKWGYAVTSKGWGKSKKEQRLYPDYLYQTLSTVSSFSPKVIEGYREAFNCDIDIIKPLGCPRTDIYFDESFKRHSIEKSHLLFPQAKGKKIILYAPTFRGKSIKSANIKYDINFQVLKDRLADNYVLITKFHPLMAKKGLTEAGRLQGYDFVFDATTLLSAEEAICAADILITDYSSIMFEFMLMERPIISFIFDIDKYISDRGLFYPYDQLAPGPYVFNQNELLEKLLTVDQWFDVERVREYKKEFMSACDGHSTERIFHYVFCRHQENEGLVYL